MGEEERVSLSLSCPSTITTLSPSTEGDANGPLPCGKEAAAFSSETISPPSAAVPLLGAASSGVSLE